MILTCPICAARFLVNPTAIGAKGREVRCGRCGNVWFATQESGARAAAADAKDSFGNRPPPVREPPTRVEGPIGPARPAPHRPLAEIPAGRRRWPARTGWAALIVVPAGIAAAASVYREEMVAFFPPAEPIYAAIGLPANPPGFGLKLIVEPSDPPNRDGRTVLIVSGRIENTTGRTLSIPNLRAALFDAEGRELQGWTFPPPVASLPANQSADFKAESPAPVKDAVRLSIVFHESK